MGTIVQNDAGAVPLSRRSPADRRGGASPLAAVVAIGFGTTVAMWATGYVARLPALMLPGPVLLGLLLACLLGGGVVMGRRGGWRGGVGAGLLVGVLNLLILGSLLSGSRPNQVVPSALWWIPGSIALSAAIVGLGAAAGSRMARGRPLDPPAWPSVMVRVAIAATLLLLAVGGLVTSQGAGLAVVDWPNSYGYNMFLYPLSRMTGGVYYEHAHRLFGALVGLATFVLAVVLQREDSRPWVQRLGWLAFALVVVQGMLGGLRVTGSFTLSTSAADMAPNLTLAVVHGVLAQVFFGTLVAMGAFTSATWRGSRGAVPRPHARADRVLGWLLVVVLLAQLMLGAILRHTDDLLSLHIAMATVVAPLALALGFRTWGNNWDEPLLQRFGIWLALVTFLQLTLGLGAFMTRSGVRAGTISPTLDVTVSTAHQWCGAVLLALAVLVLCWTHRLTKPEGAHERP